MNGDLEKNVVAIADSDSEIQQAAYMLSA